MTSTGWLLQKEHSIHHSSRNVTKQWQAKNAFVIDAMNWFNRVPFTLLPLKKVFGFCRNWKQESENEGDGKSKWREREREKEKRRPNQMDNGVHMKTSSTKSHFESFEWLINFNNWFGFLVWFWHKYAAPNIIWYRLLHNTETMFLSRNER